MRAIAKTQRRKLALLRLRRMRAVRYRVAPSRLKAWLVWGVSGLFVLLQFSLQLSSGEMVPGLMHSFSVDALGAGVLASTYYYVYVLLQSPAGMVVDRYGPRKVLSLGALVCALGTLVFSMAHTLMIAALGRMLMGTGAAFAFVGSLNLVSRWFPVERFSFMVGVAEAVGMLGSLLGGIYMADFVSHLGWRYAMLGASAIAGILVILLWLVIRDAPYTASAPKSFRPKGAFRRDFKAIIRSKVLWMGGLYSGMIFSIVTVFVALWGIPYIQLAQHVSLMRATLLSNLVFIGVAIGTPLVGWLDAHVRRRLLLVSTAVMNAALLSCVILFPDMPQVMLAMLLFFSGVSCSSYVIPFAIAHDVSTPSTRSTCMGFINMLQ
jgi:MFS family permease